MASRSWERRNARARSLGYTSYYDYRVHGYGASPPAAPRPSGRKLAALRGHRSASDLNRLAKSGRVQLVKVLPSDKDSKTKQWRKGILRLTLDDGSEEEFTLRGDQMSRGRMRDLDRMLRAGGATILDSPSLDIFGRFNRG